MLAELGAGDHRGPLVQQPDQGAQQPGLALPALSEQYDVVAGDQRPLELRDHGVLEPVQAGPGVASLRKSGQEVVADLGAQRLVLVAGRAQLAERGDDRSSHHSNLVLPSNGAHYAFGRGDRTRRTRWLGTSSAAVLSVLAGGLAVTLAVAVALLVSARRRIAADSRRIERLESDLSAALRPRPPATPTERAVSRVLRTMGKVREHGVAGLLQASIEDLQAWAQEERAEVLTMAAADGTVTLFFSDIEDSTALNDRLGDEAWVKVLAAHDTLLRNRIDRYRGQVVKTAGDGFMVAFRDAEAACRAALGIQKDLGRTLDARLRQVRVRIGIHTGRVVSRDGDYFGRNVALAARIGDLAEGGQVLASTAVRDALDADAAVLLEERRGGRAQGSPGHTRHLAGAEPRHLRVDCARSWMYE